MELASVCKVREHTQSYTHTHIWIITERVPSLNWGRQPIALLLLLHNYLLTLHVCVSECVCVCACVCEGVCVRVCVCAGWMGVGVGVGACR